VSSTQTNTFAVSVFGAELQASLSVEEGALTTNDHGNHMGRVAAVVDGVHRVFDVLVSPTQVFVHSTELGSHLLRILPRLASAADNDREEKGNGVYKATMAGKVARVAVLPGAAVKVGSLLFVMESMKMETKILAQEEGTVASVAVKEGQIVQDGELLLVVTPSTPAAK
jgi:acetyl-CoA carboxylase biotin carboxyl carrier protein